MDESSVLSNTRLVMTPSLPEPDSGLGNPLLHSQLRLQSVLLAQGVDCGSSLPPCYRHRVFDDQSTVCAR